MHKNLISNNPRHQHFSTKKCVEKSNLGKPIAVNFFEAEWKPYYDEHPMAGCDPDVPTRENPTEREYLHWLVGNIYQDQWTTGETIVDYIGPIPEHMNGAHRMVFLVYKQPSRDFIRFEEERLPPKHDQKKRGKFSSMNFAKKYNLTGPVAANFFMAYWTQNMAQNLSKPTSSTTEDPIYEYTDEESKNHTAKVKT
ncbi:protein D2 [Bemisia tabaci]|uniref:protein D2 n=1 Tax=Bemisia tabaci TaxID=7038 RepID=UPI003B288B76